LAGLNLVTLRTKAHEEEHAVFLSGNGPLVEVLREALARDEHTRLKEQGHRIRKSDAVRKVNSFVQNIMHFRDSNVVTTEPPIERVAVFDEAQRAWDAKHLANFMSQKKGQTNFQMSEPEFLISVMDRHEGWCVVICLVGGGQEINAGEAGLTEWFSALKRSFRGWKVYTSEQLAHRDYHWGQDLSALLEGLDAQPFPALHLAVSVRSFRAEKLSEFVGALVAGEADEAKQLYQAIKSSYPIAVTRSLGQAKQWLRDRGRGSERIGLVASSGASRLKPEGINVHEKIAATTWFLNGKDDVRSSYYMEDPATEFDIQGLELDWVGVCWDADFRSVDGKWQFHRFAGTKWQNVNDENRQVYLTNAYRVLLTRARQGMVIYVPKGDLLDATRPAHVLRWNRGIFVSVRSAGSLRRRRSIRRAEGRPLTHLFRNL
jgi:schlafen family protein